MSSYPDPSILSSVRAKTNKNRSSKTSCAESKRLRSLDMFGTGIFLYYPFGEQSYQTISGSCVSVFVFLLTLVFCIQNCLVLYKYEGTQFTSAHLEGHFDVNHTYTEDNGFQEAVGLVEMSGYYDPYDFLKLRVEIRS